jgi:hypothetical protein
LPGSHRSARQADELSRAKARPVEQFQQREVSHRRRLAARGAILGSFEHPLNIRFLEDSRKRAFEARTREGRGRIVFAQPVIDQESEEPPEGGRATGYGRWSERRPVGAQPRQLVGRRCCKRPTGFGGPFKIVAIGEKRMARSAGFRRHHVEETVDQRLVVRSHVRERASAAIIRAEKSCPVRLSPAMA